MYIERLTIHQRLGLLQEMRIHYKEDVRDYPCAFYLGKLRVNHGKSKTNQKIESVYKDFEIEKIYNSDPSNYDQKKFQNYMIGIFGQKYKDDLKNYLASKPKPSNFIDYFYQND